MGVGVGVGIELNKIDFEVSLLFVSNSRVPRKSFAKFKQILQMAQFNMTPSGVPVRPVTSHESFINIHPDHTGLIIGRGGATIKKIQRDTGVDVLRIRKPNGASGGMPWIQIRGHIKAVEAAYHRVLTIAQEAERRIPRMNVQAHHAPSHRHESHGTQPTFQHPFGASHKTKKNPGPIQFPHPSTIPSGDLPHQPRTPEYRPRSPSEPAIFKFEPNSPSYCPYSPEYHPQSPEYDPEKSSYQPASPRTPLSPRSPRSPVAVKKTIKLKLKTNSAE